VGGFETSIFLQKSKKRLDKVQKDIYISSVGLNNQQFILILPSLTAPGFCYEVTSG
jgi:hypothetical protein